MQQPRGVTLAQYLAALRGDCDVTTRVRVMDNLHRPISTVTGRARGGQVNIDATVEVSRSLSGLELFDPDHALHVDSDSPSDGAVYADRFVQVTAVVRSPLLPAPASVDLFTGPLVKFEREGPKVKVEAQGKEYLTRTDCRPFTAQEGWRIVYAIQAIMSNCGETFFSFPAGITARLTNDVHVCADLSKPELQPWAVCQRLARQIGCQLYYDGSGVLVLRRVPKTPLAEFLVTQPPVTSHDWTGIYNRVRVKWRFEHRKKKGQKAKVTGGQVVVTIDDPEVAPGHPMAPWGPMSRNGKPWFRTLELEGEHITSKWQARQAGIAAMREQAIQRLDLTAQGVPLLNVDPLDPLLMQGEVVSFRAGAFGVAAGEMTLGTIRTVRRPRRRGGR